MKRKNIILVLFTWVLSMFWLNNSVVVSASSIYANDFYNLLTFTDSVSQESISVYEDKIINTNTEGWTEFTFGSQSGADITTLSFDITLNYKSEQWSSITFQFRRWDANSLYQLKIEDSLLTFNKKKWSNQEMTGVITTIDSVGFGLKNHQTYNFKIVLYGWTKAIFIDQVKVMELVESDFATGCFGLESWQAGYEITNIIYYDGYEEEDIHSSTIKQIKEKYIGNINEYVSSATESVVKKEIQNLCLKFASEIEKLSTEDEMKELYDEYVLKIQSVTIEDIQNMTKMAKIFNSMTYTLESNSASYSLNNFDEIVLPIENNVSSGIIYETNNANKQILILDYSPKILNEWTEECIRFNYQSANDCYTLLFTIHTFALIRVTNGVSTKLKEISMNTTNMHFIIRLEMNETNLHVMINGESFYQIDDNNKTSGKVAFTSWNGGFVISNITTIQYDLITAAINFVQSTVEEVMQEKNQNEILLLKESTIHALQNVSYEQEIDKILLSYKNKLKCLLSGNMN